MEYKLLDKSELKALLDIIVGLLGHQTEELKREFLRRTMQFNFKHGAPEQIFYVTEGKVCVRIGTNSGHGHVWKRPDGMVARCGGPRLCKECSKDKSLVEQCSQDTVSVPREVIERVDKALETPQQMADAELMFCLGEFQHIPYQTVKKIAQEVLSIAGSRNKEARDLLQPYLGKGKR